MIVQTIDFMTFFDRVSKGREYGDARTRIRYVETGDEFLMFYADTDGIVNHTVFRKEAILTESRLSADKIDGEAEIKRWKAEYLRDAIEGSQMEY